VDAISREVSFSVGAAETMAFSDAVSREVSFSVGAAETMAFTDAVSREFSIRNVIAGDVDVDGHVDVVDLLYLVDAFGSVPGDPNYDPDCDFNADESVDVVDLLYLVDNFGR
jgi:hypothetical protein